MKTKIKIQLYPSYKNKIFLLNYFNYNFITKHTFLLLFFSREEIRNADILGFEYCTFDKFGFPTFKVKIIKYYKLKTSFTFEKQEFENVINSNYKQQKFEMFYDNEA